MNKPHNCQWLSVPLIVDVQSWEGQVSIDEKVYALRLTYYPRPKGGGDQLVVTLDPQWQAAKPKAYTLNQYEGGWRCDCPSATYNRQRDGACKHERCVDELLQQLIEEYGK